MKNIRSLLNEIKEDIKNGHDYLEYESNIRNWHRTFILNRYNSIYKNGEIIFQYEDDTSIFSGIISIDDFINKSNSEIIKYLAHYSYYNSIDK